MKIVTPKTLSKNHNVSQESDSQLLVRYVWFFLFLALLMYGLFWALSFVIVQLISIEDEARYFSAWDPVSFLSDEVIDLPQELQDRYQDVPYEIKILDMDEVENAFAALWGRLYITQAFLDQVQSYEELDFIIGHEMWHIEHRDVLRSLISSIPMAVVLSIFGGDYGLMLFEWTLGNIHSKVHETRADIYGLDFLHEKSGHVGCSLDFFEKQNTMGDNLMEIFSTHPVTKLRIERMQKYIDDRWYQIQECSPFSL